jgi:hypothetical protein
MKKTARPVFTLIIILISAAVLIFLLSNLFSGKKQQNRTSDIERYTITKSDLILTAIGSGKIASADTRNILPQGNITELKVKIGDYIKSGDTLAQYVGLNGTKASLISDYEGVVTAVPTGGYDITTGKPAASTISISSTDILQLDIQVTEKDIYKLKKIRPQAYI